MKEADIAAHVLAALVQIAPETDADTFDTGAVLREEADLDSMDFLNFVVAVHERLHIDIPESDYMHLTTIDDCVGYLSRRLS